MRSLRFSGVCTVTATLAVVSLATLVGCNKKAPEAAPVPPPTSDAGANGATATSNADAAAPSAEDIAAVNAVVNPEKLPAYAGPTGIVEGTVFVKGPAAPELPGQDFVTCPAGLDTYGKLFRAGPARADGLRPLADAVVVVTGYHGFYLPEKSDTVHITIGANCGYPTRTLAITFGQHLEVANDSKVVFAPLLSGVYQPAIMMAPPMQAGEPIKVKPPRPGHFVLGDQMQQFVQESLLVLLQPLHTVSDLGGHFRIEGVPVGKLKIGAQLDALGPAIPAVDVEVRPNVVETVDLVIPYRPADAGAGHERRPIP